jgi:hypothetical protein
LEPGYANRNTAGERRIGVVGIVKVKIFEVALPKYVSPIDAVGFLSGGRPGINHPTPRHSEE